MCAMFGEFLPPSILLHFYFLSSFPICQCRLEVLRYSHLMEAMEFHTFFHFFSLVENWKLKNGSYAFVQNGGNELPVHRSHLLHQWVLNGVY